MLVTTPAGDASILRRQPVGTGTDIGSATLTLGEIVGIAVGGGLGVFFILSSIFVFIVRRRHRKGEIEQTEESTPVDKELGPVVRSTQSPKICLSQQSSFNPFLPSKDAIVTWTNEDVICGPAIAKAKAKAKTFSPQKGFFRMSGMRDSWPLVSSIQMPDMPFPFGLLHTQSSMVTLSQVAPPGYLVEEPKRPKQTYSRTSRRNISLSADESSLQALSESLSSDLCCESAFVSERPILKRRSTSENHLSIILRSTSQRLKSAQRQSLTRTLTSLNHFPGTPPPARLPTPVKYPSESREALIEPDLTDSNERSIKNSYATRTLSSQRKVPRSAGRAPLKRAHSPTPSTGSDDSLCGTQTPDLVIPGPLTSPSKSGSRGEQRHRMRISPGGAKDIAAVIHKGSRASVFALGNRDSLRKAVLDSPHRIFLASDPFVSTVKSSKPVIPITQIQQPRPLYIRKATFGQEATSERPLGFASPLNEVSENSQSPQKKQQSEPQSPVTCGRDSDPNPFQWSPQEAMQTRSTQTSPKRARSRRKGHKRSNVIRMSELPISRPPSVCVVPEEPEEDTSPLKLHGPRDPPIGFIDPRKSPNLDLPSVVNSKLSVKPPSAAIFNPCLSVPDLTPRSADNSPTLGVDEPIIYSPTLSVCNYYSENRNSEDDFFAEKSKPPPSAAMLKSRRHGRNYSKDLRLSSDLGVLGQLISSPPPSLRLTSPSLSVPSEPARPLPTIIVPGNPTFLTSTPSIPAPPLLTTPIPGHLTGPRPQPESKSRFSSLTNTPRESLATSIGMLRRMNSEVSTCSSVYSLHDDNETNSNSSLRASLSPDANDPKERGRSRGSKHYLALGLPSLSPAGSASSRRRVEKSDSHRLYKDKVERKRAARSQNIDEYSEDENQLSTVKEGSSPLTVTTEGVVGLKFPTLSSVGTTGVTPPRNEKRGVESRQAVAGKNGEKGDMLSPPMKDVGRWSDAMTKAQMNVVRRESKMEHPNPQTPPKWGKGSLLGRKKEEMGKENGRPISLGLYDKDGFLRSSPDREGALERERSKSGLRG